MHVTIAVLGIPWATLLGIEDTYLYSVFILVEHDFPSAQNLVHLTREVSGYYSLQLDTQSQSLTMCHMDKRIRMAD